MSVGHDNRDTTVRILAICGIAGPIVFAILVTVAGLIYQDYSHLTQAVSDLGGVEAQYPTIQTAYFVKYSTPTRPSPLCFSS